MSAHCSTIRHSSPLALAESRKVLGPQPWLLVEARALMATITRRLKRAGPGFDSGLPERLPLLSDPHMHLRKRATLLEAEELAWRATGDDPLWGALAADIVTLALEHLIEVRSGAVLERFGEDWLGTDRQIVEPGHLFEWAVASAAFRYGGRPAAAALRLVAIGEEHGVHRGVARNALGGRLLGARCAGASLAADGAVEGHSPAGSGGWALGGCGPVSASIASVSDNRCGRSVV